MLCPGGRVFHSLVYHYFGDIHSTAAFHDSRSKWNMDEVKNEMGRKGRG